MTECPACAAPLTVSPSTAELTCPACRAPITVKLTPLAEGAFRSGSVRELALVPVAPPAETVIDRSTERELHLEVTRPGMSMGPGGLLVALGGGSMSLCVAAVVALSNGVGSGAIFWAVLGGALVVTSTRGILRSPTISRIRHIRVNKETLCLTGPGDHSEERALATITGFDVVSGGVVVGKTSDGTEVRVTEPLDDEVAYWVMRRLRQALRKS